MSVAANPTDQPGGARDYCSPPQLAEQIRNLFLEERSGCLILSRSGVEKRIIMDRGLILAATSSLDDETLPMFLASRGLIEPDAAQALKGLDDRQAAEALMKRRQVSHDVLQSNIRDLAFQILTAVFKWEEMELRFEEGQVPIWPVESNVIVSFELIIRALRTMASFDEIRDAMMRQERSVRFSDQVYLPFEQLGLSPSEGYIVSRIDGTTKVRDILVQVPPDEENAATRFLFGLLILGLAQFHPPIGPGMLSVADLARGDEEKRDREERERLEIQEFYTLTGKGDPATLLGLGESFDLERIRASYQDLKARFDPHRFLKNVQSKCRDELQIIEARLLEAYLALRSRPLETHRAAVESSPDRLEQVNLDAVTGIRKELSKTERQAEEEDRVRLSEQFASKAREYWKMGDVFNCIRYCEFAQKQHDTDAATSNLLGQALSRNPDYRWQKRAETALVRATELDPYSPSHWAVLGEFYISHGLNAKARKQFEKALEQLPTHAPALEALNKLDSAKR